MVLDQTGSLANIKRHDYLPFGEELSAPTGGRNTAMGYAGGDNVRQQFTAYERDAETDLDYARARFYAPKQGRFISFDTMVPHEALRIPQAWNRYSYCLNNPLIFVDPSGLDWYALKGSNQPQWFDNNPGDQYERWSELNYYAGPEFGWVHLSRFTNDFTYGHASARDARLSFIFNEFWADFTNEVRKSWTWSNISSDVQRAWDDPLGRGGLGDPAFVMLLAPNPFTRFTSAGAGGAGGASISTATAEVGFVQRSSTTMVNTWDLMATHPLTSSRRQFLALKASIKEIGIQESIKYVEHNGVKYVVDGHHRLQAATELGIKQVPAEAVQLPYKGYKSLEYLFKF